MEYLIEIKNMQLFHIPDRKPDLGWISCNESCEFCGNIYSQSSNIEMCINILVTCRCLLSLAVNMFTLIQ